MDKNIIQKTSLARKDFLIGIGVGVILAMIVFFTFDAIKNATTNQSAGFSFNDPTRPHSPYLIQRDTIDEGFSGGWMPHFLPSEEYWVDMHAHLSGVTSSDGLKQLIDNWFSRLDAYRLGIVVAITEQEELFKVFGETTKNDPRFAWIYWPKNDAPSLSSVQEAVRNGACGIKLHNREIMEGTVPRDIWQHDEWQKIFSFAETAGVPLLWHVTQRHGYSPYHGGGLYAYWRSGWEKGVTFTNEDLLQDVLMVMRRYPKLKVIGAHQLHVGPERLNKLLQEYENLYIDSSCGMYLRWADDFIEDDRILLRDFIEKWSERIVFGTDADIKPGSLDEYAVQGFLCHTRFILKLGLNDKALQDVAWRTSSDLLKLPPVSAARRGNVRP
jgi:predicted TIM-barrel fold metal-dependent hydrolase